MLFAFPAVVAVPILAGIALGGPIALLGEEIGLFEGSYKVTAGLLEDFGEARVRDTPISEEGFVGAAIGAAITRTRASSRRTRTR